MNYQENDKKITHQTKILLHIWNVGLFAYIWITFYSEHIFHEHFVEGVTISILVYLLLYNWICNVYKAFRLASTRLYDIDFAQAVAICLSDLILYIEADLASRHYLSIWPGFRIVVIQVVGTIILTYVAKRRLMKKMVPQDTLLIHGILVDKNQIANFVKELTRKYDYLFHITEQKSEMNSQAELREAIHKHKNILLLGVSPNERRELIKYCVEEDKPFYYDPRIEDIICEGSFERHLLDTPLMKYDFPYQRFGKRFVKRACDIALSLFFLILFSPLMLGIAIAIKINDGGPVFFKQKRYTKNERVFEILKFRSMVVNAEAMGVTPSTKGDPRVTKVGKFIRATRFDELPQLINILKGDMSFVGPRPERIEHVELYSQEMPEFKYRLKVKGGLTGYAQVYGKYNTSPYDKLRLDLIYIENQSFVLDFKILLLTIRTVFQKESTEGFDEKQSQAINQSAATSAEPEKEKAPETEVRE